MEKVHKAISNTTFGLIDLFSKDEEFRQTARKARATHDQTSQQIYRTVRTTNKALHILADTLIIGKAEKRLASASVTRAKVPTINSFWEVSSFPRI